MGEGERSIITQLWQKCTNRATTWFKTQSQVKKCFTEARYPLGLSSTTGGENKKVL